MENPYQSPQGSGGMPFSEGPGGLGSHIRIVATLMMIQGGLESLIAVLLLIMGGVMPTIIGGMASGAPAGPGQAPPLPPAAMGWVVGGVYLGFGVMHLVAGVLKLVAGWRNFWFRGRVLGLVALSSGLATFLPCYCFPTAVALFIYGLIVYLNGQSNRWFALGAVGATPEEIQRTW